MFEPQLTTVDADANTVTATTTENGTMMLVPETQWFDRFRSPDDVPTSTVELDEFDDPGTDCAEICVSTGDTVVVGVTNDGPGTLESPSVNSLGLTRDDDPDADDGNATGTDENPGSKTGTGDDGSGLVTIQCVAGPNFTCDTGNDGVINDYDDCPTTYGSGPSMEAFRFRCANRRYRTW